MDIPASVHYYALLLLAWRLVLKAFHGLILAWHDSEEQVGFVSV